MEKQDNTETEQTENAGKNPFGGKNDEQTAENISEESTEQQAEETNTENDNIKAEYEKLHNQYIRLAADFDNYRKRQAQERELLLQYGMQEALTKMVDVLDNFDRASGSCEKIDDIEKVKECFSVLGKQTKDVLTKLGLQEIDAENAEFDPNYHEAVMQTPTGDYAENTVIAVFQKGYTYKDKVLRPARVNVAVSE